MPTARYFTPQVPPLIATSCTTWALYAWMNSQVGQICAGWALLGSTSLEVTGATAITAYAVRRVRYDTGIAEAARAAP